MFKFTPTQWRTVVRTGLTVSIFSAFVATLVWADDRPRSLAPIFGLVLGALAFALVLTVREWVWNSRLVELRFGVFSLINLVLNSAALLAAILLTALLFGIEPASRTYIAAAVIAMAFTGWLTVDRFLGRGVLAGLLTGRYHHPRYENRVFLFADLADSTPLALQLGDLRYHTLLNRLFRAVGPAIERYNGSVHRYLGDEMIVTWPWNAGTDDAACLRCAMSILDSVQQAQDSLREEFGVAPYLRIALHGGEVVAGEISGIKREIVFSGDAINATARIQSVASELDRSLVLSKGLLEATGAPDEVSLEDLGAFRLKGRAEETELLALTPDSRSSG